MIMISVICPIFNEENYISKCINSILELDYPKDDLEILFVDGMSRDKTRAIVTEYAAKFPFIRLIDNPDKVVPHGMNAGIRAAKGDIIVRLDAHCEYPTDYFSKLVRGLKELPNADNVGGVCLTLPCNETDTAYAIAEVLSSSFGMGNSYFRTGAKEVMKVDTVPFGCFRKTIFDKVGLYDLDMVRNQDDELNGRIINAGGSIYLLPSVEIKYYARDKINKVRKMFYQYGLYKPLGNKKLGSPATLRQFVPVLFLLGVVIGGALSCLFEWVRYAYFAVLLLYFGLGAYLGIKSGMKHHRPMLMLLMPYTYLNVHLSYGWGYIKGLYKVTMDKPFSVQANR